MGISIFLYRNFKYFVLFFHHLITVTFFTIETAITWWTEAFVIDTIDRFARSIIEAW